MPPLDALLPTPRLLETDSVDLALPPDEAWALVRHGDLGRSPFTRALFALRTLPSRLAGRPYEPLRLRLDDLVSTPEKPGFQILTDDAPREVAVGAIGKVWHPDIPFTHVADAPAYAAFAEPGWVKVAWSLRVSPLGARDSRVSVEVRVDATDDASWKKFVAYFRLIGPGSHYIRRALLTDLAREHGTPESKREERSLPGDALLPDAAGQATHSVTIARPPEAIWPLLVQLAERLPAGGAPPDRFEALLLDAPRALLLGGLYDAAARRQLPFSSARPASFWQATWAFVLEPLDAATTRVSFRARAAFSPDQRALGAWALPVHRFVRSGQLRHLRARAEGHEHGSDWRDVVEGLGGAAIMTAALLTPFLRGARNHWGLAPSVPARTFPGDGLVPAPRWEWTHGVEIDAPAREVWPWVAQIGADRGGFYSYEWLENVAGCELHNAETIHPEWELREGDTLSLHPAIPPLRIVEIARGASFVAHAPADAAAQAAGEPWAEASWAFVIEPLGPERCRLLSRYRCGTSDHLAAQIEFGPELLEPIGFAMDRRMLLGIKERAEQARLSHRAAPLAPGEESARAGKDCAAP